MKIDMSKALSLLSTTILVAVGISSIAGAYAVYKNTIWRPTVSIDNADWENGIAEITVNGKKKMLYNGSVVWAGGDWGIRFVNGKDNKLNRLELIKNGLVHDTLLKTP